MKLWHPHILAALLALTPVAAQADTTSLTRLTQRGDLLGFEAVGRIDLPGGFCTGVLIAPDLVLTAAHCLYDTQSGQLRDTTHMTFRAGYRDGKSIAEVPVARATAHAAYQPRSGTSLSNIRHDAALLQLARSIPAITAAPFALHSGDTNGDAISVVSYGQGRAEALSWQRECGVLDHAQGLFVFNCDVTYGSSGAPVFASEQGRPRILSLISTGIVDQSQKLSYGMELPSIVTALKQQLRTMPAARASGTLSTNAKRIKVNNGTNNNTGAKFVRVPSN